MIAVSVFKCSFLRIKPFTELIKKKLPSHQKLVKSMEILLLNDYAISSF